MFDRFKAEGVNKVLYEQFEGKNNVKWQVFVVLQDSITFSLDALAQTASGIELQTLGIFQALIIIQDCSKSLADFLGLEYNKNQSTRNYRNHFFSHPKTDIKKQKKRRDIGTSVNFSSGVMTKFLKNGDIKNSIPCRLDEVINVCVLREMIGLQKLLIKTLKVVMFAKKS